MLPNFTQKFLLRFISVNRIKEGPKTKSNNFKFFKRILENKVALEAWDEKVLHYQFSKTTIFR